MKKKKRNVLLASRIKSCRKKLVQFFDGFFYVEIPREKQNHQMEKDCFWNLDELCC
jgi:hypothetical protein